MLLMMIVVGTVALPQLPISYFLLATSSFLAQHWLASILPPILIISLHCDLTALRWKHREKVKCPLVENFKMIKKKLRLSPDAKADPYLGKYD